MINIYLIGEFSNDCLSFINEVCHGYRDDLSVQSVLQIDLENHSIEGFIVFGDKLSKLDIIELRAKIHSEHRHVLFLETMSNTNLMEQLNFEPQESLLKLPYQKESLSKIIEGFLVGSAQKFEEIGPQLKLDSDTLTLMYQHQTIQLSVQEAGLLSILIQKKNGMVSKENILNQMWGVSNLKTQNSLRALVLNLRLSLKHIPCMKIITHSGKGLELFIDES